MEMRADLLIVGAGMVGSALALALQHSGLEILLLDGSPLSIKPFDQQSAFEPRVSALSAASQRILERLGAWQGIGERRLSPYSDMRVWDGSGTGQIHFSAASVHAEVLGHIVENRVVQDGLLERLHDSEIGLLANARLEQAEHLMALSDEAFCAELERAFEGRLGGVLQADPRVCVPLRQRHAKRYVAEGLALIGDAAHTIHPLAGQGVNLGFLDAAVLAEELQHAYERGERLADVRVLSRFERRRMPHNLALMAAMEGFERLFQADPLPLRWLRNSGLKWVEQLPEAKALFVRQALGLSGDLPELARA